MSVSQAVYEGMQKHIAELQTALDDARLDAEMWEATAKSEESDHE